LIVQAQGISSDSVIEVMVNGQVKGTIYAPGRDPSYVVTIGDNGGLDDEHAHPKNANEMMSVVRNVFLDR
jgi:hypothetical protein